MGRAFVATMLMVIAQASLADNHVLVISVDGLGASELFSGPSCLSDGSTIRALMARGTTSRGVYSVLPAITYPAHATISTGTTPLRHGVQDNGRNGEWFKQRSDIAVDTLWDAAKRAGKTVAIVTWPSTYGAQADWLVPEDLDNAKDPVPALRAGSTAGLFDSLSEATGTPALMPFTQHEAGAPLDEMTARFAAEVVRRHRPHLLLAHFLDYDHRMHADPWSPDACQALERIDRHIARILEAYRDAGMLERTTVFVLSDHGFAKVEKVVNVLPMLEEEGWSEVFPGQPAATSLRWALAGGSVAISAATGFQLDPARLALIRGRVEKRHGGALRWITPSEARALGGFPQAAFVICARPGYGVTARPQAGLLLEPKQYKGAHGYCPDEREMNAVFIASGAGVRTGEVIGRMPLSDVGPTIAGFMGATIAQATGRDRSAELRLRSSPAREPGR